MNNPVNPDSPEFLFGKIINRLDVLDERWNSVDNSINSLLTNMSTFREELRGRCQGENDRLLSLETWRQEVKDDWKNEKQSHKGWVNGLKTTIISIFASGLMTLLLSILIKKN